MASTVSIHFSMMIYITNFIFVLPFISSAWTSTKTVQSATEKPNWPDNEHASFYGASYVSYLFQEAKSTTEIHLRFKTHQADAILLLAAGRTDYCLLVLESAGLKVRINLGAGEAELTTPPGLRLNDLMWHDVHLERSNSDMLLVVDTIHRTRLTITGRFHELNIHFGIYVGGVGDFNELFLGNMDNFRGCLDNLTFNAIDVFRQARENIEQRGIHAVTWDCSAQFDATSERAYSFVGSGAFLALPTMNSRNGGTFALDLKTQGNTSVLLYNGGIPSRSDFVALEMLSGKPKLSVDKGNGMVELKSEVTINDGLWHHIEVRFSPTYIEINVDDHLTNMRPSLGGNKHFDLVGKLYLGGIELNKQARALAHGLESMLKSDTHDGSFKGCMHNFHVNDQLVGLREAEVSNEIQVDCVWEYACLRSPCIDEAMCFQQGIDGFRCVCDKPVCMKPDITTGYKLYSKSSHPDELELLDLQPLHVMEGGSELITSRNIHVILDLKKYGIRESAVLFHVVHLPEHGRLQVDIWRRAGDSIFTLLDVNSDKVRYVHDGSENHLDSLVLELEFIVRRDRVPAYLTQRHRFVLSTIITPVNDPPELKLPPGRVLRLARNTKKVLSSGILNASDEDNSPEDLVYTVLTVGNDDGGYVENSNAPGVSVERFTQKDVEKGVINFVHRGQANSRIAFRVSDGIETGQTAVLRIAAFDLEIYAVNNTGLTVTYNSFSYILPDNLTFSTNALDQDLDIQYEVARPPLFGALQRLRNEEHWQLVTKFTQKQMTTDKLRYLHTSGRPSNDDFKFTVSCAGTTTGTEYDFRITFQAITLHIVNNNELVLNQVQESAITIENLKVQTTPISTSDDDISYHLVTSPVYGALYLARTDKRVRLEEKTNFTQMDLVRGLVTYRLSRKSYSSIFDNYLFRVITPNEASEVLQFTIRHLPGETDAAIRVERIEVDEGGRKVISDDELHVETPTIKDFIFNVTRGPLYGMLQKSTGEEKEEFVSTLSFTTSDLRDGLISYLHDDSEHDRDSFVFLVVSQSEMQDFQYIGTQHVYVRMKNDNPPVRAIDKVFQVTLNGERLMTGDDLRFSDPDIDTPTEALQYTRKGIPNGALFHLSNLEAQAFQFTQKDLDDGKILFRHSGASYGRITIWVTDGQFYSTGILEIRASEPFVVIVNNTAVVVKRGKKKKLTLQNIGVDTNMNAMSKDIKYKVTRAPASGKLLLDGLIATEFTQLQIDKEKLEYESNDGNQFQDSFGVEASVDSVKADAEISVKIFPESYWEPLLVANNKTLTVDEGQSVTIDQSALRIAHPNVDPKDITFVVHDHPRYGSLELDNQYPEWNDGMGNQFQPGALTVFDQSTINEGKLKYVQTHQNVSEDLFAFDVTNGVVQIPGLIFRLHIISKVILLGTKNISVEEGGRVTLGASDIVVISRYSPKHSVDYEVSSLPSHGHLETTQKPGAILTQFTSKMLQDEMVRYVHDGSETSRDNFSVIAQIRESERESAPTIVSILIEAVNDEFPKVVNNTGLKVWEGAITPISSKNLAVMDEDNEAQDLHFLLSSIKNGRLALKEHLEVSITNFTQVDINRGRVVFLHTGSDSVSKAGFYFQATDGVNIGSRQFFEILIEQISLHLVRNEKLYVFPKVKQTITSDDLLVTTSDNNPDRRIRFNITTKPQFGRLLLDDSRQSQITEIDSFYQSDVNSSLLVYEHVKPFPDLTASDFFTFDVDCSLTAPLLRQELHIEISLLKINSDSLQQYVTMRRVRVKEGDRAIVGQENLNTSSLARVLSETDHLKFVPNIHMVVAITPLHGSLKLRGENATVGTSFIQTDVNEHHFLYVHDDSDTTHDSATFTIYLDSSEFGGTDAVLLNASLEIEIEPVNDENFELVTKSPRIDVVRGQRVAITAADLQTVDPDTGPDDIRYDVVTPPSSGRLELLNDPKSRVQSFTQLDVDSGNLYYIHEGSENGATFYFKVSDGVFRAVYRVFNVRVLPLSLKMVNNSLITLPQATTAVYLKPSNVGAYTNGNRSRITYNVTTHPKHGMLLLHDESVSQFGQMDIDGEKVIYMLVEKGASEDSFVANVWIEEKELRDETFYVSVTPLLEQRDYHIPLGCRVVLTLAFLNASLLARQTRSNPVFTLTRQPSFGVLKLLKRRGRPKRNARLDGISLFTHGDVTKRRVYYEMTDDMRASKNDSFEYKLTALDVPPAHGQFSFIFHPPGTVLPDLVMVDDAYKDDRNFEEKGNSGGKKRPGSGIITTMASSSSRTPGSRGSNDLEGGTSLHSPHISNDHLIIIGVAVGVILLGIIIIAAVKCRTHCKKNGKNKKTNSKNGGPAATNRHDGRADCDRRPDILEQQSRVGDYSNDEVPSISSRSGPTSPKLRPILTGLGRDMSPVRTTPSPCREDEWMEIGSTLPSCKVTPLGPHMGRLDTNETTLKYPYGMLEPHDIDEWGLYDHSDLRFQRPQNPMLKKNQYWV